MKIKYNILWLDDQIDEFIEDEFVNHIENYIEEEGFEPNVVTVSNSQELFSNLSGDWDLILTDYNMSDKNGAKVIEEIREQSILTEILFYTAQKEWEDVGRIDRVSFLQTSKIAGTHHEVVVNEVKRLIGLTIKKFQNIVAMRGLIMHETSSLDAQIDNIVQNFLKCQDGTCDKCPNTDRCKPISDIVVANMHSHIDEKLKIVAKKNFKKIRKDTFLYSADYKRLVLGKLLEMYDIEDFSSNYKEDIINLRNKFAHAVLLYDPENGRQYFENKSEGITFNDELCKTIRKNIRDYKNKIDEAEKIILSDD